MENFLPVFAAMSGVNIKRATDERSSELAEFPCEAPSEKQLKDWLDVVGPKIRQTHGAILRGGVPANLEERPAGFGRSDPNSNPTLPKPTGRLKFTLNPFSLFFGLLGPKL